MLPLSTGRSPRIDKLYESMRSFHLSTGSNYFSDEDQERSIDKIKMIGKQLLQKPKHHSPKKDKHNKFINTMIIPLKSADKDLEQKRINLYDKYKGKHNKTKERMINQRKDNICKQIEINQMAKKKKNTQWKDSKYKNIDSKIYNKSEFCINSLNYKKMAFKKAEEELKAKKETKIAKQVIKSNEEYYKKYGFNQKKQVQGVVERGESMLRNKAIKIEKLRVDKINQMMKQATFSPQRISKRFKTIQKIPFQTRQQIGKLKKAQKQGARIYEQIKNYPFNPKLNYSPTTQSIVKQIWSSSNQRAEKLKTQHMRQILYEDKSKHTRRSKDQISEQTTTNNTHSKVMVKNIQQVSFIFRDL